MIVSPDRFMYLPDGTYLWTEARCMRAWSLVQAELTAALPEHERLVLMVGTPAAGKSTWLERHADPRFVYLDATMFRREGRRSLVRFAGQLGKPVDAVVLDTPLDVCLERNAARAPDRQIPEAKLRWMRETYDRDPVSEEEGFDRVTVVKYIP